MKLQESFVKQYFKCRKEHHNYGSALVIVLIYTHSSKYAHGMKRKLTLSVNFNVNIYGKNKTKVKVFYALRWLRYKPSVCDILIDKIQLGDQLVFEICKRCRRQKIGVPTRRIGVSTRRPRTSKKCAMIDRTDDHGRVGMWY